MDEQLHLLTGAYALNALSDEERASFEQHARRDPDTLEEVRGLSETAAMLAYGTPAVAPPAELKAKVMASIRNVRQVPVESVAVDLESRRPADSKDGDSSRSGDGAVDRGPRLRASVRGGRAKDMSAARMRGGTGRQSTTAVRWLSAAAGVLLVATAAVGGYAFSLANGQERANQRLEALAQQQTEVMSVLLAPDATVIPAQLPDGASVTIAVSQQADKAAVIMSNLPKLASDKTYELWLISPGGATPAGLVAGDGSAQSRVTVLTGVAGASHVGITVEPAGGSPQPTTDPILVQPL